MDPLELGGQLDRKVLRFLGGDLSDDPTRGRGNAVHRRLGRISGVTGVTERIRYCVRTPMTLNGFSDYWAIRETLIDVLVNTDRQIFKFPHRRRRFLAQRDPRHLRRS